MAERLIVLLSGEVIGRLDRSTAETDPTFTYTPDYVKSGHVALSAQLTLQPSAHTAKKVRPYLHWRTS